MRKRLPLTGQRLQRWTDNQSYAYSIYVLWLDISYLWHVLPYCVVGYNVYGIHCQLWCSCNEKLPSIQKINSAKSAVVDLRTAVHRPTDSQDVGPDGLLLYEWHFFILPQCKVQGFVVHTTVKCLLLFFLSCFTTAFSFNLSAEKKSTITKVRYTFCSSGLIHITCIIVSILFILEEISVRTSDTELKAMSFFQNCTLVLFIFVQNCRCGDRFSSGAHRLCHDQLVFSVLDTLSFSGQAFVNFVTLQW